MKQYKRVRSIRKRKSLLKSRFFWFAVLFLFAIAGLFYLVVLSSLLQIQEVEVKGAKEIQAEKIKELVLDNVWKDIGFIPTKNILLVNTNYIESKLLNTFPVMESVQVLRSFPTSLVIEVKERAMVAAWCVAERCFALDEKGIIFKEAQSKDSLVVFTPSLREEIYLGMIAIEKSILQKSLEFLSKIDISITSFTVISKDQIHFKTSEGWDIYFNPNEDLDWQVTKFSLVLEQKIPSEKRGLLEYVDLRFGDQAYIKY